MTYQGERVRLYVGGRVLGFKRGKSNQHTSTSLMQLEGVQSKEDAQYYLGKRLAYIYKAKTKKKDSYYRCIWGNVTRVHGGSGVVRTKFRKNLPGQALGGRVRVFLYPSNI